MMQKNYLSGILTGKEVVNYANGCIEDPRLFEFEEDIYLSAACRAFPPGPYWEYDDPLQCMPDWVTSESYVFVPAVKEKQHSNFAV